MSRPPRWRRVAARVVVPCALAALAFAASPSNASAHAELQGTTPANQTTVRDHPDEVTLTFTENVTVAFGGVKAYAPDGSRADSGEARADGRTVTVPVDADDAGSYAVSWRAISADGHPVRGAFVFHVGKKSEDDVSRREALDASQGSRGVAIAFGVARAGYLFGILAAVGAVVFSALVSPHWIPRRLVTALLLAIVAIVAAFLLDASVAAGIGIPDVLRPDVLREQATTVYGHASLVRLALAVACLALVPLVGRRGWNASGVRRAFVTVAFVALAASLSLSGHAVGEGVSALRLPLDMVHSVAAAAWVGGLLQLLSCARRADLAVPQVRRYSTLALCSVVTLVLTGLYASWQEIGTDIGGVLHTEYGRLVLAKAALLAATMPIANGNRTRTLRELGDATTIDRGRTRLRRYVGIELAILSLVIAATAWLVQTIPAKVELRPDFIERTVELGRGGTVQLVIDPARLGRNEVHVYAFDEQQQPDVEVTGLTLTTRLSERGLGPFDIDLQPAGPGHFTTRSATIPFAGTWRFDVSVRRGRFEEERGRFSVPISSSNTE